MDVTGHTANSYSPSYSDGMGGPFQNAALSQVDLQSQSGVD